jgi:3-hydroxyisobutyrate dehydrogenase
VEGRGVAAIAVIGVGRIGAALLPRLLAAGHAVVAIDIDPDRQATVEQAGARWAATIVGAVDDVDVVFTVLPGTPEIADLALTADELVPRLRAGAVWIDLTSTSYPVSVRCAARAAEHAVAHVGAPIGGGPGAVADGSATVFAGGRSRDIDIALPFLTTFAQTVHRAGGPGHGNLAKLLVNLLWFGQVGLVAESFLLAQRLGLPPTLLQPMLADSAADSRFIESYLPRLLAGDYLPTFGLDRCVEELEAVESSAAEAGTPHGMISAVAALHRAALAHYGPVDGEMLAAAWLEGEAGSRLSDG